MVATPDPVALGDPGEQGRSHEEASRRQLAGRLVELGALGHADGDRIVFYRRPLRRVAPDTDIIFEHARCGGFPAETVTVVSAVIDPSTAEAA